MLFRRCLGSGSRGLQWLLGRPQWLRTWLCRCLTLRVQSYMQILDQGRNDLQWKMLERIMSASCRIFDPFGNPTLRDQSLCSNHPSPILTTWSNKSRLLSWSPPQDLGLGQTGSAILLLSTSKHCLAPKYMFVYFVYYRYLVPEKAKLLSDSRQL